MGMEGYLFSRHQDSSTYWERGEWDEEMGGWETTFSFPVQPHLSFLCHSNSSNHPGHRHSHRGRHLATIFILTNSIINAREHPSASLAAFSVLSCAVKTEADPASKGGLQTPRGGGSENGHLMVPTIGGQETPPPPREML